MKLEITRKAQNDLIEIWEFTYEKWTLNQADRYFDLLINGIEEIGKSPDVGKKYEAIRPGYYALQVISHLIFYKSKNSNTIEIVRILHQRMDVKNRLNE